MAHAVEEKAPEEKAKALIEEAKSLLSNAGIDAGEFIKGCLEGAEDQELADAEDEDEAKSPELEQKAKLIAASMKAKMGKIDDETA